MVQGWGPDASGAQEKPCLQQLFLQPEPQDRGAGTDRRAEKGRDTGAEALKVGRRDSSKARWALGSRDIKGRHVALERDRWFSALQVFDPVSASDTGEYSCQAQNGYGTPMMSDAVRMEAGACGQGGRGGAQTWRGRLGSFPAAWTV